MKYSVTIDVPNLDEGLRFYRDEWNFGYRGQLVATAWGKKVKWCPAPFDVVWQVYETDVGHTFVSRDEAVKVAANLSSIR